MKSALKVFKDISVHDFQMSGYFDNEITAVPIAPNGYLLPFFTSLSSAVALTVSNFKLQQLASGATVYKEYTLTAGWITTTLLATGRYCYAYNGNQDILASLTSYESGIYRFAFQLGASQYYTDTFEINDQKTISSVGSGDFDPDDVDFDFS
mgnify:CR=1 FL=1